MSLARQVTLHNWLEAPFNRVAFQRVRELVPTALIRNGSGRVTAMPRRPAALDDLAVERLDGTRGTLAEHLEASCCDAICVVHDGSIVYERYLNGMTEATPHLLMSVSKSICAATLGISIGRGLVAAGDLVCAVAPEFEGTSLDGATVQHLIDMTAGTDFVEDYELYDDPDGDAPLIEYERQAGYRPLGDRTPVGTLGHFGTYGTAFEHGERFDYRSPLTNVVARIVEVVHGERFADVVSRDLWGPLGQEHDADIMLDPLGHPVVEGGISCTARDLARFGLAYLGDGAIEATQVIPPEWVADTRHGTDHAREVFGASPEAESGWSLYRNAFWVFERDQVYSALGIFGQYCYIHRPSQTVIARLSTYPTALAEDLSTETLGAFATICAAIGG